MKTFAKIVALGAALAVAPVAFATPIRNGFVVTGTDNDATAPYVGGSITFPSSPGVTTASPGTGVFAAVPSGMALNFVSGFYLDTIPVTGEQLFEFTLAGTTYTFDVLTYTLTVSTGTINLYGMMEATGVDNYSIGAFFTMANNSGTLSTQQHVADAFTGTFSLLPEPNSLVLMGTGLLLAGFAMMRKRRSV